jgi:hypothetical protein
MVRAYGKGAPLVKVGEVGHGLAVILAGAVATTRAKPCMGGQQPDVGGDARPTMAISLPARVDGPVNYR